MPSPSFIIFRALALLFSMSTAPRVPSGAGFPLTTVSILSSRLLSSSAPVVDSREVSSVSGKFLPVIIMVGSIVL